MNSRTEHLQAIVASNLSPDPFIYNDYSERLMRARGIIRADEGIGDALARVVVALVHMDSELEGGVLVDDFVINVVNKVSDGTICFGTPVLSNAGRGSGIMAACTVLPIPQVAGRADIEKFYSKSFSALNNALGTGYDLSSTKDPAATLHELNDQLNSMNARFLSAQQRPVASMATLRADHPGVLSFIRAKREVDFAQWRFNISVLVTEDLFKAAKVGKDWSLKDESGSKVGSIDATELIYEIASNAHYCGEPGMLFKDRMDRDNPTPQWRYKSTAPCAEVAMAEGEACQFSYVNVSSLVKEGKFDRKKFGHAVRLVTRLLDASVEYTIRSNEYITLDLVEKKRRIGVGITGFADLLVELDIPYGAPDSLRLAAEISELLDYYSKIESVELARRRGAFPAIKDSRFVDEDWVRRKLIHSSGVVTLSEWDDVFCSMQKFGIRHASTTAMPPTGTSSAIIGSSRSLEPLAGLVDRHSGVPRSVKNHLVNRYGTKGAEKAIWRIVGDPYGYRVEPGSPLCIAQDVSYDSHLDIQVSFQRFLDESLAKTVNLHNASTVEDVVDILWRVHSDGLKGVSVFRDGCLDERRLSLLHEACWSYGASLAPSLS